MERALLRAGREGERVLLGPWLGEIGYELLYWIPFLRRALHEAGVTREQATVLTRGGAGAWYRDIAAETVDVLDLVPARVYVEGLVARRARAGDAKQLLGDPFDRELLERALEQVGDVVPILPVMMWEPLRDLWFRNVPYARIAGLLEHARLPDPGPPPETLPHDYVAVKIYFNDCLPDTAAQRSRAAALVDRLAERTDVVLLSTGMVLDDHVEWGQGGGRVIGVESLMRPEDNLAVQTRVIAGARGLVATYGGFSYLAPLLGIPALTLHAQEETVSLHLEVLRTAFPDADYTRVAPDDDAAVEAFVARVLRPRA